MIPSLTTDQRRRLVATKTSRGFSKQSWACCLTRGIVSAKRAPQVLVPSPALPDLRLHVNRRTQGREVRRPPFGSAQKEIRRHLSGPARREARRPLSGPAPKLRLTGKQAANCTSRWK